jgi:DNA-binding NtrC family response regulator
MKGTTISIYLPASFSIETKRKKKRSKVSKQTGRILVMDDDNLIRNTLSRMLERIGFEVVTTQDGDETVEIYRQSLDTGKLFDLVILDLTVPGGKGGVYTIRKLIEIDPDVRAIVTSGYSDDSVMANYKKYGFKGLICKPFDLNELYEVITRQIKNKP